MVFFTQYIPILHTLEHIHAAGATVINDTLPLDANANPDELPTLEIEMEAIEEVPAPPEVEVQEGTGEMNSKELPKELPPVPPFVPSIPQDSVP